MLEQPKISEIRFAAMNLLSLREHSANELADKLSRRFPESEFIHQVISRLQEQGLQSDERFAEEFVRLRQRQGKGTVLIKMDLSSKGVSKELISELLDEADPVWNELAQSVHAKRFKTKPQDAREKAKQIRFLQSRGFTAQHIQQVFSNDVRDFD